MNYMEEVLVTIVRKGAALLMLRLPYDVNYHAIALKRKRMKAYPKAIP